MTRVRKKDFVAWLSTQPDSRVFFRCMTARCPIAQFLRDTTGKPTAVTSLSIHIDGGCRKMPPWAAKLIRKVDGNLLKNGSEITAKRVRELL